MLWWEKHNTWRIFGPHVPLLLHSQHFLSNTTNNINASIYLLWFKCIEKNQDIQQGSLTITSLLQNPKLPSIKMTSNHDGSSEEDLEATKGSWTPTIILILIFVLKWTMTSPNNTAVGIRRFVQMKVWWWNCVEQLYVYTVLCFVHKLVYIHVNCQHLNSIRSFIPFHHLFFFGTEITIEKALWIQRW